jgi:ABC-type enterochelin transport system permease subunit
MLFKFLISCILSNADEYIIYHILLCIYSLPEWDILMLGGQQSIHILLTVGICFQLLVSKYFS